MVKQAAWVAVVSIAVAASAILMIRSTYPIGPLVLVLSVLPLTGLALAKRSVKRALPDIIFGGIDTGLLVIPALWGAMVFGVAGAIAGGVIGDALSDGIAGFFEGGISEWLRKRGIEESREKVTTALGKMAGCLVGAGIVLSIAFALGITPEFQSE